MNNKIGIFTLGCRVNFYESCAIGEQLDALGYEINNKGQDCDYYIVNTCAVTAESERKSRQLVRRCAAKGKVLVIGCASQLNPEPYDLENVIYIGGNREKSKVVEAITAKEPVQRYNVTSMEDTRYESMSLCGTLDMFSECRAFVKIQDGCNGKCSYCIIPKCRGKVRSRSYEDVVDEVQKLVKRGYKEIILTGIEVGAYNKIALSDLIKLVGDVNGLSRLRLGSLSPNIITDSFLDKVSSVKTFMHHIHLSLQSCNDRILSLMKRPYKKKDIYDRIEKIREYIPDCIISTDIIVGFPTETEEEFLETVDALNELKIYHVHSFPYSERKGTPAAVMQGSVPKNIRFERNARLIESCSEVKNEILKTYIGKTVSVLIEKFDSGFAVGHTKEFLEARVRTQNNKVGDIINAKVISHDTNILEAMFVETEELL